MPRILMIIVALALLGFGGWRQFGGSAVSAEDQARCEQIVRDRNPDNQEAQNALLSSCGDPGMVAMMDAQASGAGAQDAAASIAAVNQQDTTGTMVNYGMIGLGIALLIGGLLGRRRA